MAWTVFLQTKHQQAASRAVTLEREVEIARQASPRDRDRATASQTASPAGPDVGAYRQRLHELSVALATAVSRAELAERRVRALHLGGFGAAVATKLLSTVCYLLHGVNVLTFEQLADVQALDDVSTSPSVFGNDSAQADTDAVIARLRQQVDDASAALAAFKEVGGRELMGLKRQLADETERHRQERDDDLRTMADLRAQLLELEGLQTVA